ncbi:spermine oxidase-like isoform X2 [Anneissia japonica]|uniref:spermine oxidase-like isoform X2 n=1 Tax=Anneissia japonica TaxID=1529436 RepID=UPI0014255AE8|nr:spermine oxidase-like isoform X2 [Anneissia japonica]
MSMPSQEKASVLIVGGGIAGLSAADTLIKSEMFDILLLEATERLGGRILTSYVEGGSDHGGRSLELGANWIHGEDNMLYNFARDHQLLQVIRNTNASLKDCRDTKDYKGIMTNKDTQADSKHILPYSGDDFFFTESGKVLDSDTVQQLLIILDSAEKKFVELSQTASVTYQRKGHSESHHFSCNEQLGMNEAHYRSNLKKDLKECFLEELRKSDISNVITKEEWLSVFEWNSKYQCVELACTDLSEVSLRSFANEVSNFRTSPVNFNDNGFQGVIDAMVKCIPSNLLKCNTPVVRIKWKKSCFSEGFKCKNSDAKQPIDGKKSEEFTYVGKEQYVKYGKEKSMNAEKKEFVDVTKHKFLGARKDDSVNVGKAIHVICKNGTKYFADHVIITCSLGYLKKHSQTLFMPQLPCKQLHAIENLGFGTVNKVFLKFKSPFWKSQADFSGFQFLWDVSENCDDECEETELKFGNVSRDQRNSHCLFDVEGSWFRYIKGFDTIGGFPCILVGWISGAAAEYMETLSEQFVGKVCIELLSKFLKDTQITDLEWVKCTRWKSSPYILGSYSYASVDVCGNEYDQLAEPIPNVQNPMMMFAGEHIHPEFYSTAHGAMETGKTQANRLIQYYKEN